MGTLNHQVNGGYGHDCPQWPGKHEVRQLAKQVDSTNGHGSPHWLADWQVKGWGGKQVSLTARYNEQAKVPSKERAGWPMNGTPQTDLAGRRSSRAGRQGSLQGGGVGWGGVGGNPPMLLTELVKSWLSWTIKNGQR